MVGERGSIWVKTEPGSRVWRLSSCSVGSRGGHDDRSCDYTPAVGGFGEGTTHELGDTDICQRYCKDCYQHQYKCSFHFNSFSFLLRKFLL